jgi:hypothetical protein
MDEMNMGSLVKILATPQKHKKKEKVLKLIMKSDEHLNFHSSKLSGDINSLI